MKALLFSLIVTLLMVGCFESSDPLDDKESLDEIIAEAIHSNTLKDRIEDGEKLEYAPNEQTHDAVLAEARTGLKTVVRIAHESIL